MKHQLTAQKFVLTLALLACSICIFSFRQNDTTDLKTFRKEAITQDDTTKRSKSNRSKNDFRLRDLEITMRHLDEQMMKLDKEMKKIDFSKIERSIEQSTKHVDEKMRKQLEEAIAKVDIEKIEKKVQQSLHQLQFEEMPKLKENLSKMKEDLSKQNFELKLNGEKLRKDVNKAMEGAKVAMEKAKVEIQHLTDFTDELERDGLIDKKKSFSIEVKDGELYIDKIKQPKSVSDKYRKYYKKDNFSINNSNENRKIAI